MHLILLLAGALLAGFALGRIKNANKLAEVKAELSKAEHYADAELSKLVAAIRAKL